MSYFSVADKSVKYKDVKQNLKLIYTSIQLQKALLFYIYIKPLVSA